MPSIITKNNSSIKADAPPKITHAQVWDAYQSLVDCRQIQDAVILHTMYSLAVDPYTIYLLTYEGIKENDIIEYWDHKSSCFQTETVTKILLNDINYFKNFSQMQHIQSTDTQRESQDGHIVEGTFIFSPKPTNIYNRFKRKFGQKLTWLNFTPLNIIHLSKYRRKLEQKDFYPTLSNRAS